MTVSRNLYPLWVFVTVAQHSNITRASKALGISQPAASAHLRQLEESVGYPLLERTSRGVCLSAAGQPFLQQALRVFAELERLDELASSSSEEISGRVLVAASRTPGAYWLPRILAKFQREHPAVFPELSVADSSSVVTRVVEQEVSMAIVGDLPLLKSKLPLIKEPIAQDVLALTCCFGHSLSGLIEIDHEHLDNLFTQTLVLREHGSSTRSQAEKMLKPFSRAFSNVLELSGSDAVKEAVIAGLGLSVLSSWAVTRELASRHLAQFKDSRLRLTRAFYLIRRSDRSLGDCERLLWDFLMAGQDEYH